MWTNDTVCQGRVTRRGFLKRATTAYAAALVPPNERVTMACVGIGWMGLGNLELFLEEPIAQVVAVCDVDATHLAQGKDTVDTKYGGTDCAAYRAIEELFARDDIDAVCLSLPDHWHGVASIMAAQAGKDIYGEKPIAHTWAEGRAICNAVTRYGRVWQTGSWQRSVGHFRHACELVRNGRIGDVRKVEIVLPGGYEDFEGTRGLATPTTPPATLDYNRWLGPAPRRPYCPACVHKNWRYCLDYGGGLLMDWIGHHLDIAHWGLGLDHSGPIEVEGQGEFPTDAGVWDAPGRYRVTARYAGGLTIEITGRDPEERGGTRWIGDDGWIWVDRKGMQTHPESLLRERIRPGEIRLARSPGHRREFLECVKDRRTPIAPAEVGLRSVTPGYLGLISMIIGRPIRWDPALERILDDPVAERLLARPIRSSWRL